jgi:hypothetical protein
LKTQHAALDAGEDDRQVVGAECDADRRELRGLPLGADGLGEAAAVREQDADDLKEGKDAVRYWLGGAAAIALWIGLGCSGWLHGININIYVN